MNKYSSDSDDSMEHMKLDLLKSKYLHQKLKKSNNTISNNKKSVKVIKPIKGSSNPKFSVSNSIRRNDLLGTQSSGDIKKKEFSEGSDSGSDQENEEIVTMNHFADYILDKRRITSDENINNESNPSSSLSLQQLITSSQDPSAADYRKNNGDYSPAYNPSTDILAQWRLRRKLTEAKHSVRSDHQKHNLRINSLHINPIERTYASFPQTMNAESNTYIATEYGCDKIPVRDIPNSVSISTSTGMIAKNLKSDSGCQCNLDSTISNPLVSKHDKPNENIIKTKHARKVKRTVGIMTVGTRRKDASTLTDPCAEASQQRQSSRSRGSESLEWDNQSSDRDYIDIAIKKTLQAQLFDRNCHSAMSTVTSINGSQSDHNNARLDIVEHNTEVVCNSFNNGDKIVPWNEHYQMESDEEFREDDVLIDLRRRRELNLDKLRVLSLQIQNRTGQFPSVELS